MAKIEFDTNEDSKETLEAIKELIDSVLYPDDDSGDDDEYESDEVEQNDENDILNKEEEKVVAEDVVVESELSEVDQDDDEGVLV